MRSLCRRVPKRAAVRSLWGSKSVSSGPLPTPLGSTSEKYARPDPAARAAVSERERDVIIVGGGHNGLVAAAYLAKQGLDVLVLERRSMLGGAAVTEELYPGFVVLHSTNPSRSYS